MDENGFRQHLKKMGKKAHVIEGLLQQVRQFEGFLAGKALTIEMAGPVDLQGFATSLDQQTIRERMRGVALYFKFIGQDALAQQASDLREQEIAKTRQSFKLGDFLGVDLDAINKLHSHGITNTDEMLAAGCSPASRRVLSQQTGISESVILELVKLSDLSRLGAIKRVRARLYYQAGLQTPHMFAGRDPAALRQELLDFVAHTGFDGIAPLPKELRNAVAAADKLSKIVEYE